jgi:nucleotide-binding universal stress UspA family protein
MLPTIVVPLDGSPPAERALPYAERLARAGSGRLVLVRSSESC